MKSMRPALLTVFFFILALFLCCPLPLTAQDNSGGGDSDFDKEVADYLKRLEGEVADELESVEGKSMQYEIKQQLSTSDGDSVFGKGTEYYDQNKAEEIRNEDWRFYGITKGGLISDHEQRLIIKEITKIVGKEEAIRELSILTRTAGRENLHDWWNKISDCKGFCSRVVNKMFALHMIRVAKADHWIILFDTGRDEVKPLYYSKLRSICDVVRSTPDSNVLLIGRASHIGPLLYNRVLSEKRVVSVKRKMMEFGIPEDKIMAYFFGYEPPQLTDHIRELYKLDDYNVGLGETIGKNLQQINQSVIIVIRK